MTHYHVEIHREAEQETFETLPEALGYAGDWLNRIAESVHDDISLHGDAAEKMSVLEPDYVGLTREHYMQAYRAFKRAETYSNLAANADNIYRQATLPREQRAPLYQGEDWPELLAKAAKHTMDEINVKGPGDFVVWMCYMAGCAPEQVEPHASQELIDLFVAIKTRIETSDGGWNGGDVVELLTDTFTAAGIDVDRGTEQFGTTAVQNDDASTP